MPEEINRILTDHISDFCFAPTQNAKDILLKEGIDEKKIFLTGNTIVEAVHQHIDISKDMSSILRELNVIPDKYFLVTSHRQENVDDKKRFKDIITSLSEIRIKYDIPVIYPMHPRARKMMQEFNIPNDGLTLIEPVDFFSFLKLESEARLILTDSGGVQEESCVLGKPCVTLRENTERPETVEIGANILAGTQVDSITHAVSTMLNNKKTWNNPFGDGTSGKQIIDIITNNFMDLIV